MNDEMIEREEAGATEPAGEGVPDAAGAGYSGGDAPAPSGGTDDGAPESGAGEPVPAPAPDPAVTDAAETGDVTVPETEPDVPPARTPEQAALPAAEPQTEPPAEPDQVPGEDTVTQDAQVRALREVYPDFDMEREMMDRTFRELYTGAVRPTLRQVYEICHRETLQAQAAEAAASAAADRAEQNLLAHIRARGQRPQENGLSDTGAVQAHPNVERLTRSERAALARKAEQGEHIRL